MEALTALGLASNVIQIVDFTSRLISKSREIYTSADGTLEAHKTLQQAAENISELSKDIQRMTSQSNVGEKSSCNKFGLKESRTRLSTADKQLLELTREAIELSEEIDKAVEELAAKNRDKRLWRVQHLRGVQQWQSIRQALRSVWSQREFSAFESKLGNIQKCIDTVSLISLRERLDRAAEPSAGNRPIKDVTKTLMIGTEKRHRELLDAISMTKIFHSNGEGVAGLSSQLHALAQIDSRARFVQIIHARLRFSDMPDRLESIRKAHKRSFNWIFDQHNSRSEDHPWDSFSNWLSNEDSRLYWITGKPGSGKSTLMKYLYQDNRTPHFLRRWVSNVPLVHAGFFFWNSGTVMQMSRLGLLSTLLYESIRQLLEADSGVDIVCKLFPDRWDRFDAFGGGREEFKWEELQRAFNSMISNDRVRFFFMIDGLDEFDGDPNDLIKFILDVTARRNVKVCAASRPWLQFEDAFHELDHLHLEDLTRQDISNYVTDKLEADSHFLRLKRREPQDSRALVRNVTDKAEGVFLWVYLVTKSLLEGVFNADRMSDLQSRLDALPADLESLFKKLLSQIDPNYFRHACELFRLVRVHSSSAPSLPTAWELSFADDEDVQSGMRADIKQLPERVQTDRLEEMIRRVKSRCMGLIEVSHYEHFRSYGEHSVAFSRDAMKVFFFHRTARDYVYSDEVWRVVMEATHDSSFNPKERWANAFLWCFKTSWLRPSKCIGRLSWCLEYALQLEDDDGIVRLAFLDEVFRVATEVNRATAKSESRFELAPAATTELINLGEGSHTRDLFRSSSHSFIDISAGLRLDEYVRVRAANMNREDRKKIFAFAKSVRRCGPSSYSWLDGHTALTEALESPLSNLRRILRPRWWSIRRVSSKSEPKTHHTALKKQEPVTIEVV